jgi:hypothetical protein
VRAINAISGHKLSQSNDLNRARPTIALSDSNLRDSTVSGPQIDPDDVLGAGILWARIPRLI